jgi:hypothetical protein
VSRCIGLGYSRIPEPGKNASLRAEKDQRGLTAFAPFAGTIRRNISDRYARLRIYSFLGYHGGGGYDETAKREHHRRAQAPPIALGKE